jgi:hypothetical protein
MRGTAVLKSAPASPGYRNNRQHKTQADSLRRPSSNSRSGLGLHRRSLSLFLYVCKPVNSSTIE